MTASAYIGRYATSRRLGPAARHFLARPYTHRDICRVAILYEPNRISYAQVYPFVFYADAFARKYDVELRFFSTEMIDTLDFNKFDRVILQFWFTRNAAAFENVFEKSAASSAELVAFLDSFAHNDLRLASLLDGHIRFYLKKSLFRAQDQYRQPTLGDTNLTDYYNTAYHLEDRQVQWVIPNGFLSKLRLSPNFFTDPNLIQLFQTKRVDDLLAQPRDIDLHSRLGAKGSPWYTRMREHALQEVAALPDLRCASTGMVNPRQYQAELSRSRICLSPFGYGELCWRDIEAIANGAVLLKPDMSHLTTLPNLYEAGITYIPISWDFADLQEKVRWVLTHPAETDAIIREAYRRICKYLEDQQFVDDMQFLFQE